MNPSEGPENAPSKRKFPGWNDLFVALGIFAFSVISLAPMFDVKMRYHQTATVDDVLLVTITCRQTKGSKLVFDYEIRKESDQALVFTAESTQLFTNHQGELETSCPPFLAEWKKKHNLE